MKRILILVAAAAGFCASAMAQEMERDTVVVDTLAQPADSSMYIRADHGALRLDLAGFGITLVPRDGKGVKADFKKEKQYFPSRVSVTGGVPVDVGFNVLTDVDYKDAWAGKGDFLSMKTYKSIHISTDIVGLRIACFKHDVLSLNPAIRFTVDNYRFSDPKWTFTGDGNGNMIPKDLTEEMPKGVQKSKAVATYVGIPFRVTLQPVTDLRLTAEAGADLLLRAHSKYAFPKEKETLSGFNRWRATVGASLTYRRVGVYCLYYLTPLFENGSGTRPLTVGLRFGL